jgi:hypothetical protein
MAEEAWMDGGADAVHAVTEALRRYLVANRRAADSIEGVRRWWLPASLAKESAHVVEAALDRLVASGDLTRRRLPDGRLLYAAAQR